jgi:hypothetical protein
MKVRRPLIDILALSSAVACALALLLATFGAATAASDSSPPPEESVSPVSAVQASAPKTYVAHPTPVQEQAYEGMVTDTHCGARHEAAIGKNASDCTRACVHAGSQFALVNGDKIYVLSGNLEMLKHSAGHRSKIVGSLNGDTIAVSSVNASF